MAHLDAAGFAGALQELTNHVNGTVATTCEQGKAAAQSRESLKRQLQSLKSSCIHLGQKCAFADAVQQYTGTQNLKPEIDRTAAAVDSTEEDLREWKKLNKETEGQLNDAIQQVLEYYEQFRTLQPRLQSKLEGIERQEAALRRAREKHDAVTATGLATQEINASLSKEATQASQLELQLAQAREGVQQFEASMAEEAGQLAALQAGIQAAQASQQEGAASERLADKLQQAIDLISSITGIQAVSLDQHSNTARVQISSKPGNISGQAPSQTPTLYIQLIPGSLQVESAALEPALFDITTDVQAASGSTNLNGLQRLISSIRGRLWELEQQ